MASMLQNLHDALLEKKYTGILLVERDRAK